MIIEREINGEICVKCETPEDFILYCKDCGFKDEKDFFNHTCASYESTKGQFFTFFGRGHVITIDNKIINSEGEQNES